MTKAAIKNTVGTGPEPTGHSVLIFGSLTVSSPKEIEVRKGMIPNWRTPQKAIGVEI
jgi:hypothetical protein